MATVSHLTIETARNKILKIFIAIIAFVAGIGSLLLEGLNGLIVVIIVSICLLGLYYLYRYIFIDQWKRKARSLFTGLGQKDFLNWQKKVLEIIYPDLEIVSVYGQKFPAAVLRAENAIQFPFEDLCRLISLTLPDLKYDLRQKQYLKILGPFLRAPKMKGYALTKIYYNKEGKTTSFDATVTNQEQNLTTCHILEWELFKYYQKQKKPPSSKEEILCELPYRSRYHDGRSGSASISEPHNAYPLISVQSIVIYKDTRWPGEPVWRVVLAKRSNEVIIKPGFYQFQPAGGFEVYGCEEDTVEYLVRSGFNIGDAMLREYGEELFNIEEFQENDKGYDPLIIRSSPVITQLIDAIKKGTAWFEFIGVIFDLTNLRPEFSFLILIEDEFFCKSGLLGSWESTNITSPSVNELGTILSNNLFHCSSAGILQLAMENKRLQELGIADALSKVIN